MVSPRTVLNFMRLHRLAVQASVSSLGAPQASVVGFAVTDQFEIVFDTLATTRKAMNLRNNPLVAVVIGGWVSGDERTVQFEGVADEPTGSELDRVKAAYYEVYPDGRSRATWPALTYIRVRPTWVRYSDFNQNPPEVVEYRGDDLAGVPT